VLGVLWYLQRRLTKGTGAASRRRRGEGIQVLSRQGIGAKAQVVVVEVEGTRYVLGVTENGVSVIDRARGTPRRPRRAGARPRGPSRAAAPRPSLGRSRRRPAARIDPLPRHLAADRPGARPASLIRPAP